MRYTLIIFVFCLFQQHIVAQDTIPPKSNIKKDYKYSVKFDFFRLLKAIHSAQVSFEYRPTNRFSFESELNYYYRLRYSNNSTILDNKSNRSIIKLDRSKMNGFISGIAKLYIGPSNHFYVGLRGLVGSATFDISRRICTQSELSTSGDVCRCLKVEEIHALAQTPVIGYGPRFGLDIPVWKSIRLDFYLDYFINVSQPSFDTNSLKQSQCGKEDSHPFSFKNNFGFIPKTDKILPTLQDSSEHLKSFSLSIKIAYVF